MLTGSPPSIGMSAVAPAAGTSVEVSGSVMDDTDPTGLVVTISGAVTGTATVDSMGQFQLTATATGPGTIFATVTDADGDTGETETEFTDEAPEVMNLFVSQITSSVWEATGYVSDEFPDGLIVNLGGVLPSGLTATVNSDGSFSVRFSWSTPTTGIATAVLDDWWSQTSNSEAAFVSV